MRFPAYGNALWQRRLLGARPRVVCLLVGDYWRLPKWLPAGVPRLAVKTEPWHQKTATRYDWRLVAGMTTLAVDVRGPDERAETEDGWDSWFWLLAEVQAYAREVLLFTPMIEFIEPPDRLAPERTLETYAWLNRTFEAEVQAWSWPPWWSHGSAIDDRSHEELAA